MFRVLFVATLILSSHPSSAQEVVAVGTRVRLTTEVVGAPEVHRTGTFARSTADSVVIDLDGGGGTAAFSRAGLKRVAKSRGLGTNMVKYAGRGFLGGIAAGAIAGYAATEDQSGGEDWRGLAAVGGGLLGGVTGGVLGCLMGALHKTEKWQSLPLNIRLGTIRLSPHGYGWSGVVGFELR